MKSMVRLSCSLLAEIEQQTGISTSRDVFTLRERVEHEGVGFLTITLPQFEKDFLSALDMGRIATTSFVGFRRRDGVPEFLGGLLASLFDNNGLLRVAVVPEDWSYQAHVVRSVRAICLLHSKVELAVTPEREALALDKYLATDRDVAVISEGDIARFRAMSRRLFQEFFQDVCRSGQTFRKESFGHSSGALATGELYNERFTFNTTTERLNGILPFWEFIHVSPFETHECPVVVLSHAEETPSRVAFVPKTMKSPRTIAMEPVWNMFFQQGIFRTMTLALESPKFESLRLGFTWETQEFNQELARIGSRRGNLATIDLSDASDRISAQLVEDGLFGHNLFLSQAAMACRSERASLPDGQIIDLKKFASMGNALTFPVESMVFYTIIHLAWKRYHGRLPMKPLTPFEGVRVYGDDMVVPRDMVPILLSELSRYGLKVNHSKSFWTGLFRESCGQEFWAGFPVMVARLRSPIGEEKLSPNAREKAVAFHNNLISMGYDGTAGHVAKLIKASGYVPYGPSFAPGIHFHTQDESLWKTRYNRDLQRLEYRTLHAKNVKPLDPLDGWGALRKFFTSRYVDREADHLLRDGRSKCVSLTLGWTVP